MSILNLDFNTQQRRITSKGIISLPVICLSMALSACGSGSDSSENIVQEDRKGCGITGSRLLADIGFPYNRFNGSSNSTKIWNSNEGHYDWYPLELSVSTNRHQSSTSFGVTASPSDECYEIGSQILTSEGSAENSSDLFSEMKLELTFPDYNYNIRPSDSDLDDEVVTSVSPAIKIIRTVNESVNSSTSIVLSENEYDGVLNCEQEFSINTKWEEEYIGTTDPDIIQSDDDSNDFSIYHSAQFTGDQCEINFSGDFTLKDGRVMEAGIWGRLETVEDKDGYTLFLDSLILGAEK